MALRTFAAVLAFATGFALRAPAADLNLPQGNYVLAGATLLRSGPASRHLVTAVLVNPADAVRTATLLGIHGTTAFGSASLALLRFTRGPVGAVLLLAASTLFWILAPLALAVRRIERADL